jgi:hypothetical protein
MMLILTLLVLATVGKADGIGASVSITPSESGSAHIYLSYAGDTVDFWLDTPSSPLEAQGGEITLDGSKVLPGEGNISVTADADVLTFYEWGTTDSFTLPTVLTQALNACSAGVPPHGSQIDCLAGTEGANQYAIYYNAPVEIGPPVLVPGPPIVAPEPTALVLLGTGLLAAVFLFLAVVDPKRERQAAPAKEERYGAPISSTPNPIGTSLLMTVKAFSIWSEVPSRH